MIEWIEFEEDGDFMGDAASAAVGKWGPWPCHQHGSGFDQDGGVDPNEVNISTTTMEPNTVDTITRTTQAGAVRTTRTSR